MTGQNQTCMQLDPTFCCHKEVRVTFKLMLMVILPLISKERTDGRPNYKVAMLQTMNTPVKLFIMFTSIYIVAKNYIKANLLDLM